VSERLTGGIRSRVEVLAARFWTDAGLGPAFPRNIERAAMLALPVCIVKLSALTVAAVRAWLADRGIAVTVPDDARELMGCVVCHRGHVILFVCGADPDDEVRITVAHELAHAIVHYLLRRQAALAALGPHIAEVLDGDRAPTRAERTRAALAGMRIGPHAHLLPRGAEYDDAGVDHAEAEADNLALELVAPRAAVDSRLRALPTETTPGERRAVLARHFGVPAAWFRRAVPEEMPSRPVSFLDYVLSQARSQP
jgi:hypothetical protein